MSELFLGGPDRPPRFLRDLLQARIDAVPSGGSISWATYYFRDRALARALIAAHQRGVKVSLAIEGRPRQRALNDEVIAMLSKSGIGGGLRVHRPPPLLTRLHRPLHAKIYIFSHPYAHALVGSFNPSGDEPEDPSVIAEIGDQDRGHNLLVELNDPILVRALANHVRKLGLFDRLRPPRTVHAGDTRLFFYPRLRTGVVDAEIAALGREDRVRAAISHLKRGAFTDVLVAAARRGVGIELLVHDTERRVPEDIVGELTGSGIAVTRYSEPNNLPMHAKFLLAESSKDRTAWFGSFNFNKRSLRRNHELLVRSRDLALFDALAARYGEIAAETRVSS